MTTADPRAMALTGFFTKAIRDSFEPGTRYTVGGEGYTVLPREAYRGHGYPEDSEEVLFRHTSGRVFPLWPAALVSAPRDLPPLPGTRREATA